MRATKLRCAFVVRVRECVSEALSLMLNVLMPGQIGSLRPLKGGAKASAGAPESRGPVVTGAPTTAVAGHPSTEAAKKKVPSSRLLRIPASSDVVAAV
jgi:hypothetical protein